MKVNNCMISPDLSCECPHAKKQDTYLNEHNYRSLNNSHIVNNQNNINHVGAKINNNDTHFSHLKVSDNLRNTDCYYNNNKNIVEGCVNDNQYTPNVYTHDTPCNNHLKDNYNDSHNYEYKEDLKGESLLKNNYEEYQLTGKSVNNDFLSHNYNHLNNYEQSYNELHEEKPIYNKKKSSFSENFMKNGYYPNKYTYEDVIHNKKNFNIDNNNNNNDSNNLNDSKNNNANNKYIPCEKVNNFCPYAKGIEQNYEEGINNLNNKNSYNSHLNNKTSEMDYQYEKKLNDSFKKNNIKYEGEIKNLNTFTSDNLYESAHINRERNMNHTKIFDYVDYDDNDKKSRQKKLVNTFVPKYKNLSAKEVHYNSLAGNDNITVLAANKMKMDLNRTPEKNKNTLPTVYPFHLCNDYENDKKNEKNRARLEKLYPTNYNYINNYNKSNSDISLEQRVYNMNASHIFDCDSDTKEDNFEKYKSEANIAYYKKSENNENTDTEKEEKRKLNPMYSDLFGRKTPDINQNVYCERIMPTTIKNNWMHDAFTVKKYSDPHKSSDHIEYNGTEKFHRKSYFDKDGYDNTKRLQDAMKKGSKVSLQAHLQSTLQCENNYNNYDYNNVEAFYLSLRNLNDSISDEEIKKVIKSSDAHIVSYKSEYDLLSNKRKDNAKLCIRHSKGKEGLNKLINLLSQLNIDVVL